MRAASIHLFTILLFGVSASAVIRFPHFPRPPANESECARTLMQFTSFDMSVEKPLEEIFAKNAFDILPVGSRQIDEQRLTHFYRLVRDKLVASDILSLQLTRWIHMEQVLSEDLREGTIAAEPPVDILRNALQALVVTAVANDLLPYVGDQQTQYKLVFASLIFAQRRIPPEWKVKLRNILDPRSRDFIRNMGLTNYRLYYFLQKGPWTGRYEVLYHELGSIRVRTAKSLKKYRLDKKLRPFVEQTLDEHAQYIKFTDSP